MMKILLTGMTNIQCGKVSTRRPFVNVKNTYYSILMHAGHNVDWRPVKPFEDTSAYDVILIGIGNPGEYSCTHLYNALSIMENRHVAFYVDDWKVNANIRAIEDGDILRNFILKNNAKAFGNDSLLLKKANHLDKVRGTIFSRSKLLATCFEWGVHGLLIEGTSFMLKNFYTFDPSPFLVNTFLETNRRSRHREWICASIADYSKRINKWDLQWPVRYFTKKNFVPEPTLVSSYYTKAWGVIAPPYKASGSGWWRGRYNDAMNAGCILLASPLEIDGLGQAFTGVSNTPNYIENFSDKQLKLRAYSQKEEFYSRMPPKKQVLEQLDFFLEVVA